MNKDFTTVMSERTVDELIKIIIVDVKKYDQLAIEAAKLEIEKRNSSVLATTNRN